MSIINVGGETVATKFGSGKHICKRFRSRVQKSAHPLETLATIADDKNTHYRLLFCLVLQLTKFSHV